MPSEPPFSSARDEGAPTTNCKHCERPIVHHDGIWRHYVSGIAPCSVARQVWAEPTDG